MGPEPKYFDLDAFKADSPERNYWLGFLAADGCILENSNSNPQIQLTLADHDHIVKYKEFTKSESSITHPRPQYSTITLRSQELADLLAGYHIVPRKSLKEKAPDSLNMDADYWRGVIDGDGFIGVNSRGYPRLELVGSEDICTAFLVFVKSIAPTKVSVTHDKRTPGLCRIQLCGRWVSEVVSVLYKDAPIFLDRKMTIAKELV